MLVVGLFPSLISAVTNEKAIENINFKKRLRNPTIAST